MQSVLEHANEVTESYGVTIKSINVVSAVPSDKDLSNALAQGAVAAAEAQQFERVAAGEASAIKTEAAGLAEAAVLKAEGFAQAEIERAEGKKAAADLLMQNSTAVQFATIDKTAECLGAKDNKAFFFGNKQGEKVGALLATAFVAEMGMPGKTPYEPAREPSPHQFGDEKNDKFQTENADRLAKMAAQAAAGTGLSDSPRPKPKAKPKAKPKVNPQPKATAAKKMKCGKCQTVMAAPPGASQVACPGCGQHLQVPK
jgi:LSD1 subclass zinc finger protein